VSREGAAAFSTRKEGTGHRKKGLKTPLRKQRAVPRQRKDILFNPPKVADPLSIGEGATGVVAVRDHGKIEVLSNPVAPTNKLVRDMPLCETLFRTREARIKEGDSVSDSGKKGSQGKKLPPGVGRKYDIKKFSFW